MIQQITEMLATATNLLHPMVTHFPLALLSASYLLDVLAHWWPKLRTSGWVLLILGTLGAIVCRFDRQRRRRIIRSTPNSAALVETHQTSGDHHNGDFFRAAGLALFRAAQRE